jgi:hypothetical protein
MIKTITGGMKIHAQAGIQSMFPVLKSAQAVQKHSSKRMGGYLEYKKILDLKEYYHV